jgi:hypothetical protein
LAWDWFTVYWLLFCALHGHRHRHVLAAWQAGTMARSPPQRRLAVWCRLESRRGCFSARLRRLRRLDLVQHGNIELPPGPKDIERVQADYEKTYKPLDKLPQPRVRSVKYAVDIFPSTRNANMRGDEVIYNPYADPLDEIHFSLDPLYDTSIEIPGAVLSKDDTRLSYRIYRFTSPLQPGEERTLHFTVTSKNRGFENDVSNSRVGPERNILQQRPHYRLQLLFDC